MFLISLDLCLEFGKKNYEYPKANLQPKYILKVRLVSADILGKEKNLEYGKLGWHGNFDTRF